jgi:hypothetical protein
VWKWWVVLLGCGLLMGCAAPYVATPQQEAEARAMQPGPGHALIFVYRRGGSANPNALALVYVRPKTPSGASEAQRVALDERSFTVAEVPAGAVKVTVVETLTGLGGIGTGSDNTTLELPAGSKTYIEVRATPAMLIAPQRSDPRLFVRPPVEGATAIGNSRLAGVLRFVSASTM